jgi:hypothetical protein
MADKLDRSKAEVIREHRTIEAVRKGLMGFNGKLCCIARVLGDRMWQEGGQYCEQSFLPDYTLNDDEIPTDDTPTYPFGWLFSGLNRGINLEIKYHEFKKELMVRYNGNVVYLETNNELDGYNPNGGWEDHVERLFEIAKKVGISEEEAGEIVQDRKRAKSEYARKLEEFKLKWGL